MSAARDCVICDGEVFDDNKNLYKECNWLETGGHPPVQAHEPSELNRLQPLAIA